MQQSTAQRAAVEPKHELADNSQFGRVDLNKLLLLAIERALAPPLIHRRSTLQPMRIVVIDPALLSRAMRGDEAQFKAPRLLPRAWPLAGVPNIRSMQFQRRAVRGEILSDESGRLYEKLGRQIRPIHQLVSGQFGEAIDLVPAGPRTTRLSAPPADPNIGEPSTEKKVPGFDNSALKRFGSGKSGSMPSPKKQEPVGHRKLFADPGQWRIVCWGDFKEILERQLAHPERLRDTYRLPCYVQVLETERSISIDELAAVYKSDSESHARLYFLTDEIATKLDLVLPLRSAPPHHVHREPKTLLAHERVFRLLVANDPTVDVTVTQPKLKSSARIETPGATEPPKAPSAHPQETIPNRFVKEWEFKLTREEASYEINAKPTLSGRLRKFCGRLRVIRQGNSLRKWQTLLAGRNLDEQLWAVRPPAGMLSDSFLREWAEKTLELGGYDAQKMIVEWELFWRRRGL